MNSEFVKDSNGKKSGKRLYGSIMVCTGIAMFIVLFTTSIFKTISDPETAKYCAISLVGFGSGLLGFGVLENKFVLNKKTQNQGNPEIGG